jgi:uncharacterized protein YbdZ (MbtH family)|tara:strand:- start:2366 stop:2566 length:201 start_codon:yes stop_codon:yes gene_type:complete
MKTDQGWIPQEGWEKRNDVGRFCLWCSQNDGGSGWMYIHLETKNTVCGRHFTEDLVKRMRNKEVTK